MILILAAIAFILCAFALFTVLPTLGFMPQLLLTFPLAQIISFRWALAIIFILLGLIYLLFTILAGSLLRRLIAGITAIVLLGSGIVHAAELYSRGAYNKETISELFSSQNTDTPDINLLTYNTKGGATQTSEVVQAILTNHVNVAVLPETSTKQGEEICAALSAAGEKFQQFDTNTSRWYPDFSSTVLLISKQLGNYQELDLSELNTQQKTQSSTTNNHNLDQDSGTKLSIVGAEPEDAKSTLPRFYGVHPIAPLPSLIARWKNEITQVYRLCEKEKNIVLAGDFNSTLDHQKALGCNCRDTAKEAKSAALSTWPAWLPGYFGTTIDRVLTNNSDYYGSEAKTITAGGSDHRALIVQLRAAQVSQAPGSEKA